MRKILMKRNGRGERGAVLVVVAAFMIVAVVMTAAVVDLGDLRQEKKEVTLSTDAAALAGASVADLEDPDLIGAGSTQVDCSLVRTDLRAPNGESFGSVQDAVDDYLDRNGGSTRLDCEVVRVAARRGYVLVSADEIVDFSFGPAIGVAQGSVAGVSVAAIQERPGGGGLRPVAVCADAPSLTGSPVTVRDLIVEAGTHPDGLINNGLGRDLTVAVDSVNDDDGCGLATGNFGQLDLNGGSNPNTCNNPDGFCWQMENGYFGPVNNPVNGDPGNNFVPSSDAIDGLIASSIRFYVPVYNTAAGSGGNAEFNITHYLEASWVDYCLQANQCGIDDADGDPKRWFRWVVYRIVNFASVGAPSATPPRICAVSNDAGVFTANCQGTGLGGSVTPPPVPPNNPPTAAFTASCIGLSCTFADASTDSDGSVAAWAWDFGDGGTSSEQNPTRTYSSGGTRVVTLTVTDNDGASSSASGSVAPSGPTPVQLVASACGNNQEGCTFTASGGPSGATYTWTHAGTSSGTNPRVIAFPIPASPSASADYTVTVTASPGGESAAVTVRCTPNNNRTQATCAPV